MQSTIPLPVDAMLLLGPTGSGKSPLGELLSERGFLGRAAYHLDFGSALRSAINNRSSLYADSERAFIQDVLEHGALLEDEHFTLARKVITGTIDRSGFTPRDMLILNGIPRHAGQAKDIDSIASIHALIVLDCDANAVSCRLRENTGGDREGRLDDDPELVRKKLAVFQERTRPLIDHYNSIGRKIYRPSIGHRTTAEEAFQELSRLAASDPPVSLVAEPPQG